MFPCAYEIGRPLPLEVAAPFIKRGLPKPALSLSMNFFCYHLSPHLPRVVLVEIAGCSHFADRDREQFQRAVNMGTTSRGLS